MNFLTLLASLVFARVTCRSLLAGLMWFAYDGGLDVRHTCEHGDRLQRYGWIRHDGTGFGQQEIVDNGALPLDSSCGVYMCACT